MTQIDTKTRLLDAAERLFSEQGFAGTSMREITTAAKANLAAANYHFGCKEDLLSAVLERRLLPLNQARNVRIEQVLIEATEANIRPKTEDLLRAFIEPTMAFRSAGHNSNAFVAIIGRSLTAADPAVRDRFLDLVRPLLTTLHQALCLALPQLPQELVLTRLFFTIGALGHCLCFSSIAPLCDLNSSDTYEQRETLTQDLITFVTSGLESPC